MNPPGDRSALLSSLLAKPDVRDAELIQTATDFYAANERGDDTNQNMQRFVRAINQERGTDFATALLYTHFVERLKASALALTEFSNSKRSTDALNVPKIVIVPGAFYREHPATGGDGGVVSATANQNGWRCELIPTESVGSLKTNAAIIGNWLERSHESVILVSLSKGTSDVLLTLAERSKLAHKLAAWISISGILVGTPMADWLLDRKRLRPALCYMKWKHATGIEAVQDLRASGEATLADMFHKNIPSFLADIPTFHIAGFPLKHHLSGLRAKLWHRRLRPDGPNDSVIMLEDLLAAHGTIIPVWGADHYLKSSWDSARAIATIVDIVCGADAKTNNELSPP